MDRIKFTVNGQPQSVGSEVDSDHRLLDFIRQDLELRGTKYMCKEGGCGACIVAVTAKDPYTGHLRTFSVNSILPLFGITAVIIPIHSIGTLKGPDILY